jgi:signal transduction histidine kinase
MSARELTTMAPPVVGDAVGARSDSAMPEMSEFVETALHDLRAPLRNIRQAGGWLTEHLGTADTTTAEYLEIMSEAADRIDALVGALGTLGQVECQPMELEPRSIDALADEAVDRVREREDVPWTLVVEEPRARVIADHPMVVRLLEVLLGNSVEYRHPARRLVVSLRVIGPSDQAIVEVTDNGIGIEARYHNLVVDPFRRLHTRQEHPGSGLGLTIGDLIVSRHGGMLRVTGTPGEGTTVRFTLSPHSPPLDIRSTVAIEEAT